MPYTTAELIELVKPLAGRKWSDPYNRSQSVIIFTPGITRHNASVREVSDAGITVFDGYTDHLIPWADVSSIKLQNYDRTGFEFLSERECLHAGYRVAA